LIATYRITEAALTGRVRRRGPGDGCAVSAPTFST